MSSKEFIEDSQNINSELMKKHLSAITYLKYNFFRTNAFIATIVFGGLAYSKFHTSRQAYLIGFGCSGMICVFFHGFIQKWELANSQIFGEPNSNKFFERIHYYSSAKFDKGDIYYKKL